MQRAPLKFFVVGTPITHSLSPLMHNAAFKATQAVASFSALDPCSVQGFLKWCDSVAQQRGDGANVGGFCVTIPYKQEAFKRCEVLSPAAQAIGAVNTITRQEEGKLKGDNTDCVGFIQALNYELTQSHMPPLSKTSTALVVGTGGVARAIVYALIDAGVNRVAVSSRRLDGARKFCESFSSLAAEKDVELVSLENATSKKVGLFDLIVNATPLGLHDDDAAFASSEWLASSGSFVFDAVYRREGVTRLVLDARGINLPACDGRRMLVEQGIAAQFIWNEAFHFWDNEDDALRMQNAMHESVLIQKKGEQ